MAVNQQVKISNAAIHVNGVAVLGGPNEVTIEGIKAKTADSMSLGMQGTVEYTTGVEKMSMTVKLNHVDA
ncbi:phage major tail tube protein, partial [Listeria monocytogenes]|uniref:phage major tail tube protein n=1 Tax=Listeria monocytogenes TaxID=1639 RepID=UPI002FDC186D